MKDFRENSHREHLYLKIDASPKELVSAIYCQFMQSGVPWGTPRRRYEAVPGRNPDSGGAIRHFSDVEKDVNKLVNKKVQCPNPALSYRVP
jgi:hypothetical protein